MGDPAMHALKELAWPLERAAEAIQQLADRAGFPCEEGLVPPAPPIGSDVDAGRWIEAVASWLGLEADPVDAPEGDVTSLLLRAAPALVKLPGTMTALVVLGARRRRIVVLSPSRRVRRVDVETLRRALAGDLEGAVAGDLDACLAGMSLPPARRQRARHALLRERLRGARVGGCWLLRLPPGASFRAQARAEGLPGRAFTLLVAHASQLALGIGGWVLLGRGALEGRLEAGWLVAWALMLLTVVPVRLLALWLQGELAIGFGKLLKRRLLAGALRMDPEIIRREGAGQLLARALETVTIENMALNAGIGALLALIELVVVLFVLGVGSGGPGHALLLGCWLVASVVLGFQAYRRGLRWTEARRHLTQGLVERMVGHRTRLAQQDPAAWHVGEDEAVEHYLTLSLHMDRSDLLLQIVPYLWLVAGLCGLVPGFVRGDSSSGLAIGLGGVLLAGAAMTRFAAGLMQAVGAAVGWKQIGPLFVAAARAAVRPSPTVALAEVSTDSGAPLLTATGLSFAYAGRPEPVLHDATLQIEHGDRLLLEGPSGGGKSTLVSLLAGLRQPASGLLLVDGLDHPTLGSQGWRQRVAAAPQYHDNHILSDTLAFNLLFGRRWPPAREDFFEARDVCIELGLGDLLGRMPSGLAQMVGEMGWRLSHGERSRVFIARALLQRARLVILDESFAALDPKTLERCLKCVVKRAPSLLVIAHP